jgi:hypothetical protein
MSDEESIELPTTPGSVVWADSYLMLSRWGNWVSDGVFAITAEDLADEPFVILFDAKEAGLF